MGKVIGSISSRGSQVVPASKKKKTRTEWYTEHGGRSKGSIFHPHTAIKALVNRWMQVKLCENVPDSDKSCNKHTSF